MTPIVHLLLLPLLVSAATGEGLQDKEGSFENTTLDVAEAPPVPYPIHEATGEGLQDKKGPFENTALDVAEATPVPYPIHKFEVTDPGVDGFRLTGEGSEDVKISSEGWLFLQHPLDWARNDHYIIGVEALKGNSVVDGPIYVTINVLDINNHAPAFNSSSYTGVVLEHSPAGVPFTRVFASDLDDPASPNARLKYSLVSQIPNKHHIALFQINADTGEISTTAEGAQMLKAREGIRYSRGEDQSIEALKTKFDNFCSPVQSIPYEQNPFFTCVERAELRRRSIDRMEDPDYTLIVRVQDLGGESSNSLSGSTYVNVIVKQNLWVSPGPIIIKEHLKEVYPHVITQVQSNDPNAIYRLVQKERVLNFPFRISVDGEIELTEELDREDKDMYILVVFAEDQYGNQLDPPMEIQVVVQDVNDNAPECEAETVFEVQEDEPVGSLIGAFLAHDADDTATLNAQLTYSIVSQTPSASANAFSIDSMLGEIRSLQVLRRRDSKIYHLDVQVSDPVFSVQCKVVIKVIDVNNQLPLFETNDYGSHSLAEDTPVGHTLLTIKATDADEADSGSSKIEFHISEGNEDGIFAVQTEENGVGELVIVKPLDFETSSSYNLKIDARNVEPLMKGLEYGKESSASVQLEVTDVDEAPEFSLDILDVTVPEDIAKGTVVLKVEANDPEGKDISFKLDGDSQDWLEIDDASGEIKTKNTLDRETLETFSVTVTAFEKNNPEKLSERELSFTLLDINDNHPKLTETYSFICYNKPAPVLIKAEDADAPPFSEPFTFAFNHGKKSPNWDLQTVDGSTAKLTLKKSPGADKTFTLAINIKDNAGLGVNQALEVQVCNCTELGYCYVEPGKHSFMLGMGATIGILVGIVGFCIILFVIVIRRSGKKKQKTKKAEEQNAML
uniref:Cadherin 17, LI cadherin (liver-intestine) n=1 Tax=Neogobius melanostomus TaxID=47308 RepID=A0A8C6V1C4_9GOBI